MEFGHFPLFIDGEEIAEGKAGTGESTDPATGKAIATYATADESQLDDAVAAARSSFDRGAWRSIAPFKRGRILHAIGEELLRRREEIATLLTRDSGKPMSDSYWEVDCTARFFEFYGGYVDKLQGTTVPLGEGWMDWTVREPIGVSAHIVPWNYPLQVAARGIAPALAAGCSVVAKPARETATSLHHLTLAARAAGLPDGVFNVVNGSGSVLGDRLAHHPDVDQLTFTGSVPSGVKVMQAAATHAIPTTMELGGKSPQVLFADADMSRALPTVKAGMFTHAGQVCNAGTRLLVERSVHDEVVERLHEEISSMRLGAGLDNPDMGPVVSADQRETVNDYVEIARSEGTVLQGAELPSDPSLANGYFVRPTLVTGIGNGARVSQEEIFGPVLSVVPFSDYDEAITLANDSEFGLVAGVFTENVGTSMRAAQDLRAGQIWINSFGVGLDVEFPFGGYKRSGFGREKGLEALNAYLQVKNVCVGY